MRAVIVEKPGQFAVVTDKAMPEAGEDKVVIKVDYAAI